MTGIIQFFQGTIEQLKKLNAPTKKDTYITVSTVLLATLISAFFIVLVDFFISKIIKFLLWLGA